jgi:AcrR family transcriptional regulator
MPRNPPDPARRSERARSAILESALTISRERGYEKTTIEAIAAGAGVGKQTIYRWWPSKGAVVVEALNEAIGSASEFPDSGDVREDLKAQMRSVSAALGGPELGATFRAVIAAAQSDPLIAEALPTLIIEPRVEACKRRLEGARQQGQLREDVDLDVVVELLYGPLYHRFVLHTFDIDDLQITRVVDYVFSGLSPMEHVTGDRGELRQ